METLRNRSEKRRIPPRVEPRLEVLPAPDDLDADDSALRDWVATVASSRWLVLGTAAACVAAAAAWVAVATPIFRSDAVVQVEERSRGIAGLEELTAAFSSATPAETEIEIIRSRALLGGVVERLGLDVLATPRHFPIVGKAIARRATEGEVRGAPPLLGAFAWGGERIALARLEVPEALLGRSLGLVARGEGRFALLRPDGEALLEGVVGTPASGGGVEIAVTRLDARPGTGFRVTRLPVDEAVERLQSRLAVSERGRKTGILQIAL